MMRAVDLVRALVPNARPEYIAAFDAGDAKLTTAGINTPLRLAHLIAQCGAECGFTLVRESMHYTHEDRLIAVFNSIRHTTPLLPGESAILLRQDNDIADRFYGIGGPSALYAANNLNGGNNPGNPRKAQSLGNNRPGDGFVFRGNGMLQTTGGDAHRALVTTTGVDFFNHPELLTSAEHALTPVLFEWTNSSCNNFADQDDILSISRAINLGNANSTATPNGMANREDWLRRAKVVLGI